METSFPAKNLVLKELKERAQIQLKVVQGATTKAAIMLAFLGVLTLAALSLMSGSQMHDFLIVLALIMIMIAGRDALQVILTREFTLSPGVDTLAKLSQKGSEEVLATLTEAYVTAYKFNHDVLKKTMKRLDRSTFASIIAVGLIVATALFSRLFP